MKLGHRTKGFAAAAAGVALVSTTFATAQAAPLTMEPAATDAVVVSEDFEEGLGVFGVRYGNGSAPTVAVSTDYAASGVQSAKVSDRDIHGDGIGLTVDGLLVAGGEYEFSANVRFAEGAEGAVLSLGYKSDDGADVVYDGLIWDLPATSTEWSAVSGTFTLPDNVVEVHVETKYDSENTEDFYIDDIVITDLSATDETGGETGGDTGEGDATGDTTSVTTSFEDGMGAWAQRYGGDSSFTAELSEDFASDGTTSVKISGREFDGDGIGFDADGVLVEGKRYNYSFDVRFAPDEPVGEITVSFFDGTDGYNTVQSVTNASNTGWTTVTGSYTIPSFEVPGALFYIETKYESGNTSTFYVDNVSIAEATGLPVQDLTPLKSTVDIPVGVAIDERETSGLASELLLKHFDQITAENHMKPDYWYDDEGNWSGLHPEAKAMMDFAVANDLKVYGHVLVWHSQTPEWFFQDASGAPLTDSAADQQILRDRMRTHIDNVAKAITDEYGPFGSATNPINAFDVINEVVSDSGEYADGLRRSEWYRILGEEFIKLSFDYADELLNGTYAASGVSNPVKLFINDYNTEQSGKQNRYYALVERLVAAGTPIDGVGHQMHVSLAMPVSALSGALDRFDEFGLLQAVTELDVTTGTPVTDAKLVEQGYYYRDTFTMIREFAAETGRLWSATVWGLTDGRSWRVDDGAPILFDDDYQAKQAFYGAIDSDELDPIIRTANVFQPSIDDVSVTSAEWDRLPMHDVEDAAFFQLRWGSDALTALVYVDDPDAGAGDRVEFTLDGDTWSVNRDSDSVVEFDGYGWAFTTQFDVAGAAAGDTHDFDVRLVNDGDTVGWNSPGTTGILTLIEQLSYTTAIEADTAPQIDGVMDDVFADAQSITTGKQVSGTDGATADTRAVWNGSTLYLFAEITDPDVDVTSASPWEQDSVEIYVDMGNAKNGSYRDLDTQIRISAQNVVSFGTGDEAMQEARITSATAATDTGYIVEVAIDLGDEGGAGTFQGFDFQVNDASDGARVSITNWADPTGAGYQSTARWGVIELLAADGDGDPVVPGEPNLPGSGGSGSDGSGSDSDSGSDDGAAGSDTEDGDSDGLADTGANPLPIILGAILLALAGGAIVVLRRRLVGAQDSDELTV